MEFKEMTENDSQNKEEAVYSLLLRHDVMSDASVIRKKIQQDADLRESVNVQATL